MLGFYLFDTPENEGDRGVPCSERYTLMWKQGSEIEFGGAPSTQAVAQAALGQPYSIAEGMGLVKNRPLGA